MSDLKSKLPDMNELGSMASKLFKDVKSSVCNIIDDYKQKRADKPHEEVKPAAKKTATKTTTKETKE